MDFKSHLAKYLPSDEIDKLIASFEDEEQKGLLLNTNKMNVETFVNMFPNVKKHPVIPYAFLFDKSEYEFGKHILHELGAYYIQDPSAMLVSYLLSPKENEYVLDMCAAPGGKSIGASLLMKNKGLLVSNDTSRNRLDILLSNVERLGLKNVSVISNDFSKNYKKYRCTFDKIILDAPCSGSGMFRKLDSMRDDWSYNKVLKFAEIQKELILASYHMLKDGGELIYSTCSYSYEEDEEVIDYLLENSDAEILQIEEIPGAYRSEHLPQAIHLFSSHFKGEGHFICKIKKPGTLSPNKLVSDSFDKVIQTKGSSKEILHFEMTLKSPADFSKFTIRSGLNTYSKIGDKIIPSHAYARSLINDDNFFEVNLEEAKKIILGETINVELKNGYYYPSYIGLPIGVVHIVDGRMKNLYPKGLRKKII